MRNQEQYLNGIKNKTIRYYFYSQRGLGLFNEFRYVFMCIFGLYVLLKLSNPWWMVVMFVVVIPVLLVAGYIHVHHISKVVDWLNVEYATHWSRYQFILLERQIELLTKIAKEELNDLKDDKVYGDVIRNA